MSPLGWLALAAVLLACAPARLPARLAGLAGSGRLVRRRSPGRRRRHIRAVGRPLGSGLPFGFGAVTAGGAAALAALMTGGVLLGIAVAAVAGTAGVVGRDVVLRRQALARHAQLLAALRVLIAELEAGGRAAAALIAAADAAPAHAATFRSAAATARTGGDADRVLAADPDTELLGHAWRLGEQAGAPPAAVLTRVAADLGAADEQRRAVAVALAGPRSSAALLTGLPLLGLALGLAMGARPLAFLAGAPAGRAVCCAGVLLDVAGVLWMRRILRKAQQP